MTKPLIVKQLTVDNFKEYGTFGPLTPPTARPLVQGDVIGFWPDCGGVLSLGPNGNNELAIGICQVTWRELKIDVSEFHSSTGEGNMPLDGDIYIHVAPPTAGADVPLDELEVFLVPQGTAVVIKPGVWHHAPFATEKGATVNTVILLPQRTYANDCVVCAIADPVPFTTG
jgi:ureidoglycolate lyase